MKNSRPFNIILDSYSKESASLYAVIQSFFNYPALDEDEEPEAKLYASAFAYLCSNYLKSCIDFYEYEDFELFVEEMNFAEDELGFYKLNEQLNLDIEEPEDFSEMIWELIQVYKNKIAKDIHTVFPTQELKLRLFASVFMFNDGKYLPDLTGDTLEFVNSFDQVLV